MHRHEDSTNTLSVPSSRWERHRGHRTDLCATLCFMQGSCRSIIITCGRSGGLQSLVALAAGGGRRARRRGRGAAGVVPPRHGGRAVALADAATGGLGAGRLVLRLPRLGLRRYPQLRRLQEANMSVHQHCYSRKVFL